MPNEERRKIAPTLVIGIGRGGVRTIKTIYNIVRNLKGAEDKFKFLAIDSSQDDLDTFVGDDDNIKTLCIPLPDRKDIKDHIDKCSYLYPEIKKKGQGAVRQRPYGRFLLDCPPNFKEVRQEIDRMLVYLRDSWMRRAAPQDLLYNIWIVHTLGGGTGSGAFPMLVSAVSESANEVFSIAHGQTIDYYISGIAFVPTANTLDLKFKTFDLQYFANAYSAMQELKKLSSASNENPVTIYSSFGREDDQQKFGHKHTLNDRPFHIYFLYGVNEEKVSDLSKNKDAKLELEKYLEGVNISTAESMIALHHLPTSFENIVHAIEQSSPFATFSESELIIPIEGIKKLLEYKEKLGKDVNDNISNKIAADIERMISDISTLDEKKISDSLLDIEKEYRLNGIKYFVDKLEDELKNKRKNKIDADSDYIDDLWNKLKLSVSHPNITDLSEMRKLIINALKKLKEQESRKWLKDKKKLKKIETHLINIDSLQKDKESLGTLIDFVKNNLSFKDEVGADKIKEYVNRIRKEKEVLSKKLSTEVIGERVMNISISEKDLDELGIEHPADLAHIDIVDKLGLEESIKKAVSNRIEILRALSIYPSIEIDKTLMNKLFVLGNSKYEDILMNHIIRAAEHYNINKGDVHTYFSEDFSPEKIRFTYYFAIPLENIGEFEMLDKEYKEGNLENITKVKPIGKIFAHPEWFPNDPNVQNVFKRLRKVQ